MKILFFTIITLLSLNLVSFKFEEEIDSLKKFGYKKNSEVIIIVIDEQKMYQIKNLKIKNIYSVSTAKVGIGSLAGSNKTPLGVHKIVEKKGENEEIGTIFRWGNPTAKKAKIFYDKTDVKKDLIISRVMKLKGLEKGKNLGGNCDSYNRGIWIHGTQEEGLIGTPSSHGCIRMKNKDVVKLFDDIKKGTFVIIVKD